MLWLQMCVYVCVKEVKKKKKDPNISVVLGDKEQLREKQIPDNCSAWPPNSEFQILNPLQPYIYFSTLL